MKTFNKTNSPNIFALHIIFNSCLNSDNSCSLVLLQSDLGHTNHKHWIAGIWPQTIPVGDSSVQKALIIVKTKPF